MTQPPDAAAETPEGGGISITRVFDVPRELVWTAWTTPEGFGQWFGLEGSGLRDVAMDVRPGGTWSATMIVPNGSIPWRGEYREVVPPERLVVTITDEPGNPDMDTLTVILNDLGGRTEMVFNQDGRYLPLEAHEGARDGWGKFFDRLESSLAAT
jgi:uncharacterized protein YndB with AHSA1/START domain